MAKVQLTRTGMFPFALNTSASVLSVPAKPPQMLHSAETTVGENCQLKKRKARHGSRALHLFVLRHTNVSALPGN